MHKTYATELVRRIAPNLKGEFAVQPLLSLEIKLHLERLKLMELIRASRKCSWLAELPGHSAITRPRRHSVSAISTAACLK